MSEREFLEKSRAKDPEFLFMFVQLKAVGFC
jgi:hypothetical protein